MTEFLNFGWFDCGWIEELGGQRFPTEFPDHVDFAQAESVDANLFEVLRDATHLEYPADGPDPLARRDGIDMVGAFEAFFENRAQIPLRARLGEGLDESAADDQAVATETHGVRVYGMCIAEEGREQKIFTDSDRANGWMENDLPFAERGTRSLRRSRTILDRFTMGSAGAGIKEVRVGGGSLRFEFCSFGRNEIVIGILDQAEDAFTLLVDQDMCRSNHAGVITRRIGHGFDSDIAPEGISDLRACLLACVFKSKVQAAGFAEGFDGQT